MDRYLRRIDILVLPVLIQLTIVGFQRPGKHTVSQSTSSNGGISLNDEAFFSVLLPDIENQIENEFQLPNLNALESFAQQFSASTKYLQLSTAQIALSTDTAPIRC